MPANKLEEIFQEEKTIAIATNGFGVAAGWVIRIYITNLKYKTFEKNPFTMM